MLLDAQNLFSSSQAITAAATTPSTNVVDLTVARDIGPGYPILLACEVVAAFVGGTSVQVNLVSSANNDLSSPTILASSPVYLTAQLTLGAEIARFDWPVALAQSQQRYIGLDYVSVGTFTAGAITAGLILDRRAFVAYPSGLNIGGF